MQLIVPISVKRPRPAWRVGRSFADQDDVRIGGDEMAQLPHDLMRNILIAVVEVMLSRIAAKAEPKRVVRPTHVLTQPIDSVKAKAVDTTVEPEPDDVPHGGSHRGVLPVQIRLFLQK